MKTSFILIFLHRNHMNIIFYTKMIHPVSNERSGKKYFFLLFSLTMPSRTYNTIMNLGWKYIFICWCLPMNGMFLTFSLRIFIFIFISVRKKKWFISTNLRAKLRWKYKKTRTKMSIDMHWQTSKFLPSSKIHFLSHHRHRHEEICKKNKIGKLSKKIGDVWRMLQRNQFHLCWNINLHIVYTKKYEYKVRCVSETK